MADLIESIKNNPIGYYVGLLIGLALLALIIYLIIKNNRKKQERIKEITEEKARIERHVDLESMIAKMQEQEQNKLKDVDPVANFEQEQEEKAIISYQELVNAVKVDKQEPINVINVSSEGDILSTNSISKNEIKIEEPVFIDEMKISKSNIDFDPMEEVVADPIKQAEFEVNNNVDDLNTKKDYINLDNNSNETIKNIDLSTQYKELTPISEFSEDIKKNNNESSTKFKNSEFISPIYGRQNSNISYPKIASFKNDDISSDDKIINISSDIDPNEEFLKTLRNIRG